ncbi:thioredoxin family protein [uncultured Fibrobacter sp.]|uniref:thioredoxin family protein n=1 Tax=uncultured Fibrobacter sp. TaxID=261512 RepID=UPI002627550C|nr:thioredoxin family protein [uncultured Fibrobacter sp.]
MTFLKKIVVLLCCFAAFSIAASDKSKSKAKDSPKSLVQWMNYDEALEKAKLEPKLVFVDLYADWCVPCRIMDANVYNNPTVASLLNSRFYAVKLDADSQDTITCDGQKKTVQRCYYDVWELNALPAFVLVAPKGLSILTVTQSMTVEDLQYMLYQFLEKEKEWIAR